ncbi:unnamed protein product [Schistocephalus solidus]|uniref:Uncharacterized protein n=1 Tax=Schistocephalus solidus TaxID=70667 RepID=A0A183TMA1_SCHSO|nr:unnamed protein product [Schistocephalus solidus]
MANWKLLDERDERYCQRPPSLGSIDEDSTVASNKQFQAEPSFDDVSLGGGSGSSVNLSAIPFQAQVVERGGPETEKDGSVHAYFALSFFIGMKSAYNLHSLIHPSSMMERRGFHFAPLRGNG